MTTIGATIDPDALTMDAVRAGEYDTELAPRPSSWKPGDDPDRLCKIEQPQFANSALRALLRHPALGQMAASLTGAILFILGTASAGAWALTQTGFAQNLSEFMRGLPGGWMVYLLVTALVFLILGCLLEGLPAIVLLAPLMFPIAKDLGIHSVHYSMVVVVAMNIGLFMPPVGIGFYIACSIGKVEPDLAIGTIWFYLGALMLGLLALIFLPVISIIAL